MDKKVPKNIILFRIVHRNNVEFILKNGICTKNYKEDPNYINIGDNTLISQRNDYPVRINPPGGNLGDYIPFYFGRLSPMLLKIKTGNGVTKRSQNEIIYVCCEINQVITKCNNWCFTDGHAKTIITNFFNDLSFLNQVDWDLVSERYWSITEGDYDRMRRKQAEFLVVFNILCF